MDTVASRSPVGGLRTSSLVLGDVPLGFSSTLQLFPGVILGHLAFLLIPEVPGPGGQGELVIGDWHFMVRGFINNRFYRHIYNSVSLIHFLILFIPLCLLDFHISCKAELRCRFLAVFSCSYHMEPITLSSGLALNTQQVSIVVLFMLSRYIKGQLITILICMYLINSINPSYTHILTGLSGFYILNYLFIFFFQYLGKSLECLTFFADFQNLGIKNKIICQLCTFKIQSFILSLVLALV